MYDVSMKNTQLPKFILSYCKTLLQAPWRFTLVYLSLFSGVSHDVFTKGLQKQYHLKELLKTLLDDKLLAKGYLIVDETDVDKSFAKIIPCLSWIFSHRKNKHIFGLHIVAVAWTNGSMTIPLGWKIYQKSSGKTKLDLAIEIISYCLFTLRIQPHAVLFDSFYASEKILKFLHNHKQSFFSQLPKNRLFNHIPLSHHEKGRPYWTHTGYIKGQLSVQIVRNRKKYYVTNVIGIPRKEQLDTYRLRWKIEEVFRFVKSQLGFEKCQSTSLVGQNNHFGACFITYAVLQDIAEKTQMTVYALKLKATQDRLFVKQLNLSVYFDGA